MRKGQKKKKMERVRHGISVNEYSLVSLWTLVYSHVSFIYFFFFLKKNE